VRALPQLLDEPVDALKMRGELGAAFFDGLINPDEVAAMLAWLNDPSGWKEACQPSAWASFASTCREAYGLNPDTEGPITGAERLGARSGPWKKVWDRFVEAPERYPNIPNLLRQAEPTTLLDEHPDSWPGFNERAEDSVREALLRLKSVPVNDAVQKIRELEANHGPRRASVWARLGQVPLANALAQLADLADRVARPLGGTTQEIAEEYARDGWKTDNAAMQALAEVDTAADHVAVAAAVDAIYRGWLDQGARTFQKALGSSPFPAQPEDEFPPGTCVLFVDGLRLDVAEAVRASLSVLADAELEWTFAAVPTVTPTAKPAVSPVAALLVSGPGLSPSARPDGPAFGREGLRKLLQENGWQDLASGEMGYPSGRAWVEGGDIDTQGHNLAAKFPRRLEKEVKGIVEHVMSLLEWGWKRVVVVTDHGWLYLPGGLPKVELPIHAAEVRKGRCARLKESTTVDHQILAWRWDPKVRIAVAPGIGCYEAGKVYEHGGISPQESITPRLTVEPRQPSVPAGIVRISSVRWVGLRCRIEVTGAPEGALVDLRTLPADAHSSIAAEPKPVEVETAALVVPDDTLEGRPAVIVVLSEEGDVLAQQPSVVGGEER
ncbi:MAG: BREX-1 system phosphatase PglZ type B, partial [Dehalococcoidia bacterium]